MTPNEFEALVAALDQQACFNGKRVADIPELAAPRVQFRRTSYRLANIAGGLAVFNFLLATADQYGLWWLSALSSGLMVWLVLFSERQARAMTRQLNRPVALQLARDLAGLHE